MKLKRFLSFPILSLFLLLGFVYYVTVFIFIEDWLGLQSSAGSLNALILSLLVSLCVFTLMVCVLSDPGRVPSGYVPDVEDNQGPDQEIKKSDHHCIWINNCVGHRNYKAFLLLVFYACVASTYSAIIITSCTFQKDWDSVSSHPLKSFYVSCGFMSVFLSLILGTLLLWHIYLTTHNMTTIEYHDAKRAAWLAKKSGLSYHHPYDVGVYKNITLVLGPNMLKWMCPTAVSHVKDGLGFPTIRDNS
ncbi:hypothetical protein RD792_005467 [Penstemon davidsonii]|uniref:S-acyltransferase n=1 Tax=Penstemon davidsonii TaxID=160366 RepID=A0ABR0DL04_9LAMI|nr:hypothetical protein RD792_005467 [Penstemon davidsonii]